MDMCAVERSLVFPEEEGIGPTTSKVKRSQLGIWCGKAEVVVVPRR